MDTRTMKQTTTDEATLEAKLPAGIPRAIKLSQFAKALGLEERTVRYWTDEGRLEALPTPPGKWRYVKTSILLEFQADGWPVDWEKLF